MSIKTGKSSPLKVLILTALLATVGGCQSLPGNNEASLYQELGQRSGIEAIVETLLYRIVEDPRIAFQFRGIDVADFHRDLTNQLCELANGPCQYTGRTMREAHQDMAITETQFNALVENLILAMESNQVPVSAQNRLLERLAPMHSEVRGL